MPPFNRQRKDHKKVSRERAQQKKKAIRKARPAVSIVPAKNTSKHSRKVRRKEQKAGRFVKKMK